jgi:thymidylate kinase
VNAVIADVADADRCLSTLLEALERGGAGYCLVRTYDDSLPTAGSDVDLVTSAQLPAQFGRALAAAGRRSGWRLVQVIGHGSGCAYVLARAQMNQRPQFLRIDAWTSPEFDGHRLYSGDDLLRHRRRDGLLWVPSPAIEFGCYLVKRIVKRDLTESHGARLSRLFALDPAGCARETARWWGTASAEALIAAAMTGRWETVRSSIPGYRAELLRRDIVRDGRGAARRAIARTIDRARRIVRPANGLHVVFLGSDGVGKTTLIGSIERELAGAFADVALEVVAPSLSQIVDGFRGRERAAPNERAGRPHALAAHPLALSLVKAMYWLVYYTLVYLVTVRPSLAKGRLVLQHRHLLDALVDPKRYRYGGPQWVLRLLLHVVPRPDVVLLLDAPSAVVRSRKQELPQDEIERQRVAYRALATAVPHGHVLDAAAPRGDVARRATEILLDYLAHRAKLRIGP